MSPARLSLILASSIFAAGLSITKAEAEDTPVGVPAAPASQITVRAGDHGDFARIVFTTPPAASYKMVQLGDLVVLTFPNAGAVPGLEKLPGNVRSVEGGVNQAAIGLAPGAKAHVWRVDRRVIVDVFGDPAAHAPAAPSEDTRKSVAAPPAKAADLPSATSK